MAFLPLGRILILLLATAIFLGWTHRVLDRMRLTDTTALLLLAAMFAGTFLPDIPLGAGVRIGLGGAVVPVGVCIYLITTADEAYEKRRAVVAALITAAVVFGLETLLPPEPGTLGRLDVDPVWAPAIVAAVTGYLAGRSRRSAFIAGVLGLVLADVFAGIANVARGVPGAFAGIGRAGVVDSVVLAGFLAVLLAETVGETREFLARRQAAPAGGQAPDPDAPAAGGSRTPGEGDDNAGNGGPPRPSPLGGGGGAMLSVVLALLLMAGATMAGDRLWREGQAHRPGPAGETYRLLDESGRVITHWGHPIFVDDEYIDADNRWYRVLRVDGRNAFAQTLGQFSLSEAPGAKPTPAVVPAADAAAAAANAGPSVQHLAQRRSLLDILMGRGGAADGSKILIIHTHNAESYVRSDGEEATEGRGGIHKVGEAFAQGLEDEGFTVIHDESLHLPHDRGAYRRSRQTIVQHLRDRPAVVVDVHRDAVPQEVYAHEIDGQGVTQVRAVVGRQNPNSAQNLQFARQLKAVADELYPGLMKGIFFGRGNYNQDLGPRVILLEMGSHTNARESAERSAGYMAKVMKEWFDRHFED